MTTFFDSKVFEDFFNLSIDIFVINGLDGYFRLVNPAFVKLLGYTEEEILSTHFLKFVHPDDVAATGNELNHRNNGVFTKHFENRYRRKDGTYAPIAWTCFPVTSSGLMYAVGREMTAWKKAENDRINFEKERMAKELALMALIEKQKIEDALRKSQMELEDSLRSRDEFLCIASHELKTPISSLKIKAQLLQRTREKGLESLYQKKSVDSFVDLVDKQISKMTRLVDDMLDVSRIRTGQFRMEWSEFNLSHLVQEILDRMQETFQSKKIKIQFLQEGPPAIGHWDKLRLEQVILNLLSNAVRYGKSRPIHVALSNDGQHIHFQVQDFGEGVALEFQEKNL